MVIVTDFLSGFGGTERYTVTVAGALAARGIAVEVFVAEPLGDSTWSDVLTSGGVPVHSPARADATAELWRGLNRSLATQPPEAVLVNPLGRALIAWLATLPEGCALPPVVGVEYSQPGPQSAHWYPTALRSVLHRLSAVITTCTASHDGVVDYLGYSGPVHVIPHPIAPPRHVPPPTLPRHHLGAVARLSVEKGLDFALAALTLLARSGVPVNLSIYGAGVDRGRVLELASCLGIADRVHLAGKFHPVDDLDETLSRHAIWVQPSLFESVPTTLLELLARGRTVIATAVGGVPEALDDLSEAAALLVPPGDTRALADRIVEVLDDRGHLGGRAAESRARVLARHAPDHIADQIVGLLTRSRP